MVSSMELTVPVAEEVTDLEKNNDRLDSNTYSPLGLDYALSSTSRSWARSRT